MPQCHGAPLQNPEIPQAPKEPSECPMTTCCLLPLTFHPQLPDSSLKDAELATRGKCASQDEGTLSPPHFPMFYSSRCVFCVLRPQLPDLGRWSACLVGRLRALFYKPFPEVQPGVCASQIFTKPASSCYACLDSSPHFLVIIDQNACFIYFITLIMIQNVFSYLFTYPTPESKL